MKALPRAASWPPSCILRNIPADEARTAKANIMTASNAITTMATMRTEESGTQTVLNSALDSPTKTPPIMSLPPTSPWRMYWTGDDGAPSFATHSRYCSIENRASWSKAVVKITPTWHDDIAVGSIKVVIKSIWAHRATLRRNTMRTSLLPSRKTDEPWPLTLRNRAADAALTTMPLCPDG